MKKPQDYIIFPLDVPSRAQALEYVTLLKDRVGLFKVGLELFISQGPDINGTSWNAVNSGLPKKIDVLCLAVSGKNLFAGTIRAGVFLSTNNGTSWKAVNSGLPKNIRVICLAVSGKNLFAGTGSGPELIYGKVYLSTDNGTSWKEVNSGLHEFNQVRCLAVSETNLYAGTYGDGVWRLPLSDLSIEKR